MDEKPGVEKFLLALGLKSSWLESPGLESSWLKSPGLKGLGLKLWVEKSGVEMSFNQHGKKMTGRTKPRITLKSQLV